MKIFRYFLFVLSCFSIFKLQSTATIIGVVTNSLTNIPISGALVQAYRGNQVRYTATTDADGNYTLSNIEPSNYTLVFSANGYQAQAVGVKPKNNRVTTVNFQLTPNGGNISGVVTDVATLLPIAGAIIIIFQNTTIIATTTTDAGGNYLVSNLAPGTYTVLAKAANHQAQLKGAQVQVGMTTAVDFSLISSPGIIQGKVVDAISSNPIVGAAVTVYDGTNIIGFSDTDSFGNYSIPELAPGNYTVVVQATNYQSQAQGATVAANGTTTVNFALQLNPGTISGTVTNASTGTPIAGAHISIFQNNILIASLLTDPEGNYSIDNFAPGSYTVIAQATGFQTQIQGAIVQSDAITIVNFALIVPPGNFTGAVVDQLTSNPISGAHITVFDGSIVVGSAFTDNVGNYTIPGLEAGNYTVIAQARNYQFQAQGATIISGGTTIVNFALQLNPGTISGTVTNAANGIPIPGANISIFQNLTLIATVLTDMNGQYLVENLQPGNYTIVANEKNFEISILGATVSANNTTQANFALIANPGQLAGKVTDADTMLPIAGTIVEVFDNIVLIATAVTDTNGNYLITNLAPGDYIIVAAKGGYQAQLNTGSISSNITTVVNYALSIKPGNITGTVTSAMTANPISGALVAVFQNLKLVGIALTNNNGQYNILNLAPGNYTVVAIARDFQSAFSSAVISANSVTVVNFALASDPSTNNGIVKDACTGNPIPGAIVQVIDGPAVVGFDVSDMRGAFSVSTLAPGNYVVEVIKRNYITARTNVTVPANSVITTNFSLIPIAQPPARISGRVICNKYLLHTDIFQEITWYPSPSSCISKYLVLRNGIEVARVLPSQLFKFVSCNNNRFPVIYSVQAVNSFGQISKSINICLS